MSTHSVTLRHGFEAAHRLPHLGGKCTNLHGHSWRVEVTLTAPVLTAQHTLAEFGAYKAAMRAWIDSRLDHGAMLGRDDPLVEPLRDAGKVFVFGKDWPGADWPTVEAVAELLADYAGLWLADLPDAAPGTRVEAVRVTETPTNAAAWTR